MPYIENSVTLKLNLPTGTGEYAFSDPTAYWGSEHVSGVPIPPSALLLVSGLLGLVGFGWQRKRG